ncbi:MAG: DNA adenine methylase [Candidatus Micropelagos sp.]|nr:DNA adenine methylase [Candidatus Micropelagos sp.]
MPSSPSPLRYPGGKGRLGSYLSDLVRLNSIQDGHYFEPYAGGAGAAWHLLLGGYVKQVHINDASHGIAAFWRSALGDTEAFIKMIIEVDITIDEYRKQKEIFKNPSDNSDLDIGFSTFFINRVNRSGILNAGPIGGYAQEGNYKIDARFNKKDLAKRIKTLSLYSGHIHVYQKDALEFISEDIVQKHKSSKCLIYCDPPYYQKGSDLYLDYYKHHDHTKLAGRLKQLKRWCWILSYDDCQEIRDIYSNSECQVRGLEIPHSVNVKKKGEELLITPPQTIIPNIERLKVA